MKRKHQRQDGPIDEVWAGEARERVVRAILTSIALVVLAAARTHAGDPGVKQGSPRGFIEERLPEMKRLYEYEKWSGRVKLVGEIRALPPMSEVLGRYGSVQESPVRQGRPQRYEVRSPDATHGAVTVVLELAGSAAGAKEMLLRRFAASEMAGRAAQLAEPGSEYDIGDVSFYPPQAPGRCLDCTRNNVYFRLDGGERSDPATVLAMAKAVDAELMRVLEGGKPAPPAARPTPPPTPVEAALSFFDALKAPMPADIPQIVKHLASLPRPDPKDQREHPYEFELLVRTMYTGYDKLIAAVKSAAAAQDVPLVKQALAAVPEERELRGKAADIQRAAVSSLRRIGTPEAMEVLTKIADTAKTPHIFEDSTEAVLKAMPEEDARRIALEQVQAMAANPDAQPDKLLFYMRALGPQKDPPQLRVVRDILRRTANEKVRAECLRVLAEWVTEPAEARGDVLRILEQHLGDGNAAVRQAAARALGRSGDVRYLRLLAPLLDDTDASVRRMASEAACSLLGWDRKQAEDTAALKARIAPILEALSQLEAAAKVPQGADAGGAVRAPVGREPPG